MGQASGMARAHARREPPVSAPFQGTPETAAHWALEAVAVLEVLANLPDPCPPAIFRSVQGQAKRLVEAFDAEP